MANDTMEIYVRDLSEEEAADWLRDVFGEVEQVRVVPIVTYGGQYEGTTVPVQVAEGVKNGPYTSLWFNAADLPWEGVAGCARAAHTALHREVLCYPDQAEEPWTLLRIMGGREERRDERELDGL